MSSTVNSACPPRPVSERVDHGEAHGLHVLVKGLEVVRLDVQRVRRRGAEAFTDGLVVSRREELARHLEVIGVQWALGLCSAALVVLSIATIALVPRMRNLD